MRHHENMRDLVPGESVLAQADVRTNKGERVVLRQQSFPLRTPSPRRGSVFKREIAPLSLWVLMRTRARKTYPWYLAGFARDFVQHVRRVVYRQHTPRGKSSATDGKTRPTTRKDEGERTEKHRNRFTIVVITIIYALIYIRRSLMQK